MFKDDLINWSAEVDTLYKEAKSFVVDKKLPALPTFETATTRKGLYESYAVIVEINNELSMYLVRIQQMMMFKAQFKRLLRNEGYGASVNAVFNNTIEETSERVGIIDRLLNTYKYGVESQLRFYQSVQYIMSTPRLNSYD